MARTLEDAIREAHEQGLAIHNLFQMPDGSWRACIKVFGATHDLAVNPTYLNYADGDDPAECIDRAIATSDGIKGWKARAELSRDAMDNLSEDCIATVWADDRPAVKARKEGHQNRPTGADAPPKPSPVPVAPAIKRKPADDLL